MKTCIILGTRPEIVKFSPIIKECEKLRLNYFILHTGQHYSYNMDRVFFEQLELPNAKYNLDVGSGTHGKETGEMLIGIEKVLQVEQPDVVLVEGDTNTVLAGAVAAVKLGIKVGHVEAGLRSYDRSMPEEVNRILADHCSDYLFAPTEQSKQILLHEGLREEDIFVTGNTVVDAVYQNLAIAQSKTKILNQLDLEPGKFMLATSHRQENVDDPKRFANLINGLKMVQQEFRLPLIYPIHPRAKKQLDLFGISTSGLTLVEPLDYLAFLELESKAGLVFTDSGGVQEETCVLGVPCVTLRDNTERPETLEVGSNMLAGTCPDKILDAAKIMWNKKGWVNPFGDGKAGQKIVKILLDLCQ
ncbi:MAG: UDP-N-acetylglucosamine 2-epimerase (non-hydrolyzing) [Candidatus Bathyarchaeia archaeon]